jgi:hypothetical protein
MKLPKLQFTLSKTIRTPFLVSYLFAAITSFLAIAFYLQLPPTIPLFYTIAESTAQLTNKEWVFLFPSLALTIALIHTSYLQFFSKSEKVTVRLFAWATAVVQIVLSISLIRILMLVL